VVEVRQAVPEDASAIAAVHVGSWQAAYRGLLTYELLDGLSAAQRMMRIVLPAALPEILTGCRTGLVLALITAIVSLIPTIGGFVALVPLALVPLLQGSSVFPTMPSTTLAVLVVGVNLIISQVIWNVVAPKILGDAVALPLPIIIVGVFVGAALGGFLGAFLIVPLLGTLRVIVIYLIKKIVQEDPFPGEAAPPVVDLATL